ncbi:MULTISPECIES: hypothetical protein [unclassified Variovorax]|uniref:hypothetical protein n=1 Tax=unclassified Variovorax TaxID=663243 RepID=UPI0011607F5D|nr:MULTISPECIES: hypothetical protein [unclassified Variovorax]
MNLARASTTATLAEAIEKYLLNPLQALHARTSKPSQYGEVVPFEWPVTPEFPKTLTAISHDTKIGYVESVSVNKVRATCTVGHVATTRNVWTTLKPGAPRGSRVIEFERHWL